MERAKEKTRIKKRLSLGSLSAIVLSLGLVVLGQGIVYGVVSLFLTASNTKLSLLDLVSLIQNLPYYGLVPQIIGVVLLTYLLVRSRFQIDTPHLKKQVIKPSIFMGIFIILVSSIFLSAPIVRSEAIATSTYYLQTPLPIASTYVGQYDNNSYFIISGDNWKTFEQSPNVTQIEQDALASVSSGNIWSEDIAFNYNLTIPLNVTWTENLNGLTRVFCDAANNQGSPYTISIDKVNSGYYLAQDSANRYVNNWSSTNASCTIQRAINALPSTGGRIFFKNGVYNITNQLSTLSTQKSVVLEGESTGWFGLGQGVQLEATAPMNGSTYLIFGNAQSTNILSLGLDGNSLSEGAHLTNWDDSIKNSAVSHCTIGLVVGSNTWISDNWIEYNTIYGIYVSYASDGYIWIENNIFYNPPPCSYGIYIQQSGTETNRGQIWLQNNRFFNEPTAIDSYGNVTSIYSNGNSFTNQTSEAFKIEGVVRNFKSVGDTLEGGSITKHFLYVTSTGIINSGVVDDASIRNITSTPFMNQGTAAINFGIIEGFVTSNGGSTTNTTATTCIINHGLAGTPNAAITASFNDTGITGYTITSVTSTQLIFTIQGTPTGNYTCYWHAEYHP